MTNNKNTIIPKLCVAGKKNGVKIQNAYKTALKVVFEENCVEKDGSYVLKAGGRYRDVWTRDGAYNTWMCANLISPDIAKNTLNYLTNILKPNYIAGTLNKNDMETHDQYWDKMIWSISAWDHYLITHDTEFLKDAYISSVNTVREIEDKYFDADTGLMKGPAFMCDGIGSLPKTICDEEVRERGFSNVMSYTKPFQIAVLSSNCILYEAYKCIASMGKTLKTDKETLESLTQKASLLKKNINKHLWNGENGRYDFFKYYFGENIGKNDEHQEAAGHGFAVMFDVADAKMKESIFSHIHTEKWGIPLSWPDMENKYIGSGRFLEESDGYDCPQNITIWPNINGIWARACAKEKNIDKFYYEFNALTELINKSNNTVYEIYHAKNGDIGTKYHEKKESQTWAATAYIGMILFGIFGIRFNEDEMFFEPVLEKAGGSLKLEGIRYGNSVVILTLRGCGSKIKRIICNGKERENSVKYYDEGLHDIIIETEQ